GGSNAFDPAAADPSPAQAQWFPLSPDKHEYLTNQIVGRAGDVNADRKIFAHSCTRRVLQLAISASLPLRHRRVAPARRVQRREAATGWQDSPGARVAFARYCQNASRVQFSG